MKNLVCLLILCNSLTAFCQIRLPRLINDNAVLQREKILNIFGWASPNEDITFEIAGKILSAKANEKGEWLLKLPPQKAGGPFEIVMRGKNEIVLHNILFGDVWLCSGQSNMELTMDRVKDKYSEAIAASTNSFIRHFDVPDKYDFKEENSDLTGGHWKEANPENVLTFSAVAYFFAREVYAKHRVPIGLINASLGGSPAEAWISESGLEKFPHHLKEAGRFKNDSLIYEIEGADKIRMSDWYSELAKKDIGLPGRWHSAATNDSSWKAMNVPGNWSADKADNVNGSVWVTRTFNVPESMVGKEGRLQLGRIVDQDSVFINGKFVGTTGYQYPPRRYAIKRDILFPGENRITVRVISQSGRGGFIVDKPYFIAVNNDTTDLRGLWKYQIGATMSSLPGQTFIRWKPLGLYNGMIAPLTNFPITGVIWYQGEANTGNPAEYASLFPALIRNWRTKWSDDFPFFFVQLANFMEKKSQPTESNWARLREAQRRTLSMQGTAMTVAIDLGEWNDIHPLDKQAVGARLALHARKMVYGEKKLVSSGPVPRAWSFEKGKVLIRFANGESGLISKDSLELRHFAISQDGKTFVWAQAKIEKDAVIVWHPEIMRPMVVRYAWADNPDSVNFYNVEGLPATPFEIRKEK